jgi:DNA-binding NarL/FixJ family response regulator
LDAGYAFFYFVAVTAAPFSLYFIYTSGMDRPETNNEDWITAFGITRREAEVIKKITAGMTNQQIADELFITLQTVKDHNSRIYQKLDVRNRTQLIRKVHELI